MARVIGLGYAQRRPGFAVAALATDLRAWRARGYGGDLVRGARASCRLRRRASPRRFRAMAKAAVVISWRGRSDARCRSFVKKRGVRVLARIVADSCGECELSELNALD